MSSFSEQKSERLFALQALRAIAALLVTLHHVTEEAKFYFGFTPWIETNPFGKGVDLFFVLSGFIIYYASRQSHVTGNVSAREFLIGRLVRVVPMYYIFTSLMVLTLIFAASGVKETKFDIWQVITSYLFVPYERYDGRIAPTLSLGWTLNYELFFYMLFSACLAFGPGRIARRICGVLFVVAVAGVYLPSTAPAAFREWSNSIILEFAFGIIVASTHEKFGRLAFASVSLSATVVLVGLFALYYFNLPHKFESLPRFVSAGLPAALVLIGSTLLLPRKAEVNVPKILVALGDSSYSLYLSHRFVLRPMQILFKKTGLLGEVGYAVVYIAATVLISVVVGHLVFRLLERPMLNQMRRILLRN